MKKTLALFLVLLPLIANANSIQNFFSVDETQNVFRGREPGRNIEELQRLEITDVIVFKNDTRGEVEKELSELEEVGIIGHHIPFYWKDIPSIQVACEQVIEALTIIKKARESDGKVFFHCTAGEDRTGLLAGIFKMLDEGVDQQTAFQEEMCAKGYSDGNARKPKSVTGAIEKGLTPLFIEMSRMIERGELSMKKLDKKVCKNIKISKQVLRCRS